MNQCHLWVRTKGTRTLNIIIVITNLSDTINVLDRVWNVMAHAQKPDFFFRRNGRVHLNRRGRQFSRLLAAEVCASAVVMLDTPCSEVVWRVLATHSIHQFPLHFPSRASPCAITFQLDSTTSPQEHTCRPLWSFSLGSNQVRCVLSRDIDWHNTTQQVLTLFILCSCYFQQCYIVHLERVLCFCAEERATGCYILPATATYWWYKGRVVPATSNKNFR